jgi:hypothetical protein
VIRVKSGASRENQNQTMCMVEIGEIQEVKLERDTQTFLIKNQKNSTRRTPSPNSLPLT